jgi:lipid-binding SYLF domain-containing protein
MVSHGGIQSALDNTVRRTNKNMRTTLATILTVACALGTSAFAADREAKLEDRIDASADLMSAMMHADDKGVPQDLLDKAHCVVLIPGMKKAGFIVGAQYGKGFAVCRRPGAGWTAPAAMQMEGGSFGFQIGASDTDVLLLVMNDGGMKHLTESKFTLGGDASVAAGPLGRTASAETDATLQAEILSYSRSRGVFAGISLAGASLRPDGDDNRALYGHDITPREILRGEVKAPAVAARLVHSLDRDSMTRSR